ncbi:MAG TPA: hypothetical protein VG498_06885, partial [Terriglobales bacterium]|nr:hypothetical protein [Terriglobales bacterium]
MAGRAVELGLRKFERHLTLDGSKVTVEDSIQSDTPHIFTVLLHSDDSVQSDGKSFRIAASDPSLQVSITMPRDAKTAVEANELTAPGAPGSVDKGSVQKRGERLAISTVQKTAATFRIELSTY